MSEKPDPKTVNPEDKMLLEHAKQTIGDHKLKISLDFSEGAVEQPSILSKYKQIIDSRRRVSLKSII